ncbi:hypothetical protein J4401_02270 [Candidatus Woesearchaeota archaeon]|nr:hypothetical protein [Candidatus Woesearchaeota archaeon]
MSVKKLNLEELTRFCADNSLRDFNPRHYKGSTTAQIMRNVPFPKTPIIVGGFGSAFEMMNSAQTSIAHAENLARGVAGALAEYAGRLVYVTGACPDNSLPSIIAAELKKNDDSIPIIGISPGGNLREATMNNSEAYNAFRRIHDVVIYSDFGNFRMRDGLNVNFVGGAINVRGSTGTNDEIAGLFEGGKVVGLLRGSGGATDAQTNLIEAFREDGKHHYIAIYEDAPDELVRKVCGQLGVDYALREDKEACAVDLYWHRKIRISDFQEPVINVRSFKLKPNYGESVERWENASARPYPHVSYDETSKLNPVRRDDLRLFSKTILRMPRDEVVGFLDDIYGDWWTPADTRANEAGRFYFPKFLPTWQNMDRLIQGIWLLGSTHKKETYYSKLYLPDFTQKEERSIAV